MGDEIYFLLADKYESILQTDSITLGVRSQISQSTKNNKFSMSLEYLSENVKDEVDFLPAYKHRIFLEIDTVILGECGQTCPNYLK